MNDNLRRLLSDQREFVRARDWEQFHTPKNLAMALGGEVGELACAIGHLLPGSPNSAGDKARSDVVDEFGDVVLYLLRLYDVTGIDPQLRFGVAAEVPPSSFRPPSTPAEQLTVARAVFDLTGTAGRLLEAFQWEANSAVTTSQSEPVQGLTRILHLTAESLCTLGELLGVNVVDAAAAKNTKNGSKYPVELSRGSIRKYTELDSGTQ
ncbi:nucleotide pyrophosphohydrolase [Rhodococcus sp. NPDC058521]|uniref:nucleotide pyrophosphohydrolase n=1 Tax=Rhodococcus sp. NPDC058521 TaxID=3346536 RepID=UPI00365AAAD3